MCRPPEQGRTRATRPGAYRMYQVYGCRTFAACLLALAVSTTVAPRAAQAAPADEQYAVAAGFYARQEWQRASDEFKSLLADYPNHERADSARFFHAEALV